MNFNFIRRKFPEVPLRNFNSNIEGPIPDIFLHYFSRNLYQQEDCYQFRDLTPANNSEPINKDE